MTRPCVESISQWNSRTEIIYCCPNCGTSFNFYSYREHFCHNCGEHINWKNVPTHCILSIAEKYHSADTFEKREQVLDELVNWVNSKVRGRNLGKEKR